MSEGREAIARLPALQTDPLLLLYPDLTDTGWRSSTVPAFVSSPDVGVQPADKCVNLSNCCHCVAVAPSPSEIFDRAVEEGERRLDQSLLELVATSFIAGFTIVFGFAALGIVHALVKPEFGEVATIAGALAFGVGVVFCVTHRVGTYDCAIRGRTGPSPRRPTIGSIVRALSASRSRPPCGSD